MKQLLQNLKTGQTSLTDVPIPTPQPGQALVRVAASLVSAGTERMLVEFAEKSLVAKARSRPDLVRQVVDKIKREGMLPALRATFNRLEAPITLGYSSAGTITALGADMPGFQVGQQVACAGGGYAVHAEYNLVPRRLLTPLPASVDLESAAFTTLGAIALHGFRLTGAQLGDRLAIIGMGLLGLLAGQMAAAAGCRLMGIDTDPARVALATSLGLNVCLRPQAEAAAQSFTQNLGFDSVLICADTSSNDPVELAALIARDRARIVATGAVGLTFPRKIYYEKELSFVNSRSYGPGRYDPAYEEQGRDYPIGYVRWTEGRNFQAVVDMLENKKLNVAPLISHRFPIEQAPAAYQVITGKTKEPFLGVLLTYPPAPETSEHKMVFSSVRPATPAPVRLGVIGAGLFANGVLLPAIRKIPAIERLTIASSGGLHAADAARKFGFASATSSSEDVLNDPQVNTIAILTRHDQHADLVVKGLQSGRHVFVEKPLAITPEQLEAVSAQLAAPACPLLTVGYNRRFAPLARALQTSLAGRHEPLFMHYRINAGTLPLNHWTQDMQIGGGRIIGEACHFIDLLTFLANSAPLTVSAHALPDQGKYNADNVTMTFTFGDGSLGVVDYLANGDKSASKERLEVFCAGSIAVLEDFRSLALVKDGRRSTIKKAQDKGWYPEWLAFSEAIRLGGPAPIPYDQLLAVTRATFAVLRSLQSNGQVTAI